MDEAEVKTKVRAFLVQGLAMTAVAEMDDRASLLAEDLLDSTAVVELATFLQTTFGVEIRDDELVPENLDSIAALSAFVVRKRAAGPGAAA
jgi:acyl carrier protein